MKRIIEDIEELYNKDYSDMAIANALGIDIDYVEEVVAYLQETAYYQDLEELTHYAS
jgi:AraC-like DNA-binding protein